MWINSRYFSQTGRNQKLSDHCDKIAPEEVGSASYARNEVGKRTYGQRGCRAGELQPNYAPNIEASLIELDGFENFTLPFAFIGISAFEFDTGSGFFVLVHDLNMALDSEWSVH